MRAIEGFVENGQIRLTEEITLIDNTTVYVLIPDSEKPYRPRIMSPRLADPRQAVDFKQKVIWEEVDA